MNAPGLSTAGLYIAEDCEKGLSSFVHGVVGVEVKMGSDVYSLRRIRFRLTNSLFDAARAVEECDLDKDDVADAPVGGRNSGDRVLDVVRCREGPV